VPAEDEAAGEEPAAVVTAGVVVVVVIVALIAARFALSIAALAALRFSAVCLCAQLFLPINQPKA